MKKFLFTIFLLIQIQFVYCQYDADVIRYSLMNFGGTGRSLGMANSFGALGADMSATYTNPGGLGLYRSGEISGSLGFNNRNSENEYLNSNKSESQFKMAFSNAGMLWHFENQNYSKWKGWTFAMAYNQTNNHSSNNLASGFNDNNSILHSFCESLGKNEPSVSITDNLQVYQAYGAYPNYNGSDRKSTRLNSSHSSVSRMPSSA